MQPRHGFSHSNETDQNGAKHHYWVQNGGLGALFRFWTETVHRFVNGPNRCIKCNPDMVSRTVTKLTKTEQNITIGSKKVDCVRSFRFWTETVHRFVNGPNRCIKCNPGMVSRTVTKLTKTNQNISIGSKKVDWVRSFHFWTETVHRFVNGPNRCIKCNPGMVSRTVTKLTKTEENITIGSKKVDWVRSFRSGPKLCIVSLMGRTGALNATPAWFLAQQ